MLSKCLNPQCGAKFRYLGQGRLYRIDFLEAQRRMDFRKGAAGAAPRGRRERTEFFWLCARCAETLTVEAAGGEVCVIPRLGLARKAAGAEDSGKSVMIAKAS